ncbi:MAG: hypothetical protein A2X31_04605 [Elusimicrobia bacterium GWB2_63_22]|nr:MAG: hypothetical protein A2X31_04605 [Elusimicrobia bacterium GWB2_63_22]
MTLILGRKMGHQHERYAWLCRQSAQELLESLKPAGGSADSGDPESRGFFSHTVFGTYPQR